MIVDEIAKIVGGVVHGDGNVEITGIAPPVSAGEGDLTFAMDEAQMKAAEESDASCVVTPPGSQGSPKTVLRVGDVKTALTVLYNLLPKALPAEAGSVHPTAVVGKTAVLGENVSVGAHSVVGEGVSIGNGACIGAGCMIGDNATLGTFTRLYAGVIVYDHSVIGNNVVVHAGTVIGADGFGYVPKDGNILKVPQMGKVIIEDDVEIGANSCVDRGTFTDTVIGRGSKLDNLVQVAHNVRIGRNVLIAAQTGIAGSSTVGDDTMMGGQAGVSDHIDIGRNVRIGAQSGVTKRVEHEGAVLFGCPARDAKEYMKQVAFVSWLYSNAGRIRGLLKKFSDNTRGEK